MKKWMKFVGTAAVGLMALTACGGQQSSAPAEPEESNAGEEAPAEEEITFKIGATQIVEHPSLDAAYEGFQKALEDAGLSVSYDFQSAQGDQNNVHTIANNFVANNVDLIFTNSTVSTLGALNATNEIPIVFASVSDPVAAGLVTALDEPGENITGVIDLHPEFTQKTVQFIEEHFEGATVGIIIDSGEQNSIAQLEAVKAAMEGTSLTLVERSVDSSAVVAEAARSLADRVDVFLMTTDNTVVQGLGALVGVANDYDIPLIVGDPESLEGGGFATYGVDFFSIGYRAGEMAVQILKGEKVPSEINVEIPPELTLLINKKAAEEQGVEWNDQWEETAEVINN
ncbi:ABC transporter substrate-binding protein [Alkalihalobacterium chitinilyticum]|uniref:ABC transporter substrate-binding protein n=1 Tax=Alkalihalobacterium chitinilyticum TaxID=2980103 RepID=A0ABT5VAT2_9BACI|nr:ABC transporter substrate-binding protein [Alkalihalobacterium chitinilyticum]MDE5412550.1 ABC transporter substrate-binding protein [Alkalihalobacterium chitinilyticum]